MKLAIKLAATLWLTGCTFCVVHEKSKFEVDCQARGGRVRTLTQSQLCVTDAAVATTLLDDNDAG